MALQAVPDLPFEQCLYHSQNFFLPPTRVSSPGVNAKRMFWEGQCRGSISEALLFPRQCRVLDSVYANCGN